MTRLRSVKISENKSLARNAENVGMAGKKRVSVGETGKLTRLVASVPADVVSDIDDALAAYRRAEGHKVSVSGFVEVALRELLEKTDINSVLKRYGAVAKRVVNEE